MPEQAETGATYQEAVALADRRGVMHLRPYQQEAIVAVKADWAAGIRETLLVMATGLGKTNTFLALLMAELDACPDARALVLAHRTELVDQPLDRLRSIDEVWLMGGALSMPRVGVIQAQRRDLDRQLTFATVQSLRPQRVADLLRYGKITHLVVDEAHHATAPTYLQVRQALLDANPDLFHLGVTATPIRADGDGLAKVYQKDSARVSIADGVRWGFLTQPRWLAISTGISIDGVHTRSGDYVASELADRFDTPQGRQIIVQAYQKYATGRRAIAFTASVQGAVDLAAAFRDAGVSAYAVSGETPREERTRLLGAFRKGEYAILCNCQVAVEGFDAPGTSCVLMCCPTRSDGAYIQKMGRGLRPAAGRAMEGEDCLILDFVPEGSRNIVMAGDVLGIPKEQAKAARELLQEEAEPGEVQLGFTFDGHNFDTSGTPLEIIARQLDYLNASRWQWDRRDGWLTLGLGPGADGVDRTLAIAPTDEGHTLYGLRREPVGASEDGKARYGQWKIAFTRSGALEALCELAERQADRYAVAVLAQKNRTWHKRPATEGQIKYLRRLAPKGEKLPGFLTSGDAASLITHFQVKQAVARLCDTAHG
jgi:superfamily II DNA or RNA helicase